MPIVELLRSAKYTFLLASTATPQGALPPFSGSTLGAGCAGRNTSCGAVPTPCKGTLAKMLPFVSSNSAEPNRSPGYWGVNCTVIRQFCPAVKLAPATQLLVPAA